MIKLTEKAAKEVKRIIAEMNNEQKYLRVAVKGGGCSGFKFSLSLDDAFDEAKDNLLQQDEIQIVIDKRSSLYLENTTIDFVDDLNKRGFSFNDPNIKTTCGCGSSFSM